MTKIIATYGLVTFTVISLAAGQLMFKISASRLETLSIQGFLDRSFLIIFVPSLALYGVATLAWILVLRTMPLSTAYVFIALAFVLVPIAAAVFLGESINYLQWIGFALIAGGVVLAGSAAT